MKEFRPVSVKDFYNAIHCQYYDPQLHQVSCRAKMIHEEILSELSDSTEGLILDVGCASQRPLSHTVGCDLSIEALKIRKIRFPENRAVCADIIDLPFKAGCFSSILAGLVFDHVALPAKAFHALNRICLPASQLVITLFDKTSLTAATHQNNRLNYSSRDGRSYAVPSHQRSERELADGAQSAGWSLTASAVQEIGIGSYRLSRLDFVKERADR